MTQNKYCFSKKILFLLIVLLLGGGLVFFTSSGLIQTKPSINSRASEQTTISSELLKQMMAGTVDCNKFQVLGFDILKKCRLNAAKYVCSQYHGRETQCLIDDRVKRSVNGINGYSCEFYRECNLCGIEGSSCKELINTCSNFDGDLASCTSSPNHCSYNADCNKCGIGLFNCSFSYSNVSDITKECSKMRGEYADCMQSQNCIWSNQLNTCISKLR